jgi:hypothetical protein
MPEIPAFRMLRKEDHEPETSWDYMVRPSLNK